MHIEINGETESYTGITLKNANGDTLFDGVLKREPDQWCLYTYANYAGGDFVTKFSALRSHLGALGASLKWVEKNIAGAA